MKPGGASRRVLCIDARITLLCVNINVPERCLDGSVSFCAQVCHQEWLIALRNPDVGEWNRWGEAISPCAVILPAGRKGEQTAVVAPKGLHGN